MSIWKKDLYNMYPRYAIHISSKSPIPIKIIPSNSEIKTNNISPTRDQLALKKANEKARIAPAKVDEASTAPFHNS